jgi:hypothetical protein
MSSGDAGQSADGVGIDADQASGGANATALVEVPEHVECLFFWEMAVEQGRPLALGESILACLAVEQPDVVLLAVAGAGREVTGVTRAVEGAVGVLATEAREVVHGGHRSEPRRSEEVKRHKPGVALILRSLPPPCSVNFSHDQFSRRESSIRAFCSVGERRCSSVMGDAFGVDSQKVSDIEVGVLAIERTRSEGWSPSFLPGYRAERESR